MEAGILFQVAGAETAKMSICGSQRRHDAGAGASSAKAQSNIIVSLPVSAHSRNVKHSRFNDFQ